MISNYVGDSSRVLYCSYFVIDGHDGHGEHIVVQGDLQSRNVNNAFTIYRYRLD